MYILFLGILALFVGPIFYLLLKDKAGAFLDSFILFSIVALIVSHIFPFGFRSGGYTAFAIAVAGMVLPYFFHRMASGRNFLSVPVFLVAILGIMVHAGIDGVALAEINEPQGFKLALAVILHRVSVGAALWWITRPAFGTGIAVMIILVIVLFTVIGFFAASEIGLEEYESGAAYFQSFMAGSLLHVLFSHQPSSKKRDMNLYRIYSFMGAVTAFLFLVILSNSSGMHHEEHGHHFTESLEINFLTYLPGIFLAFCLVFLLELNIPKFLHSLPEIRRLRFSELYANFRCVFPDYGALIFFPLSEIFGPLGSLLVVSAAIFITFSSERWAVSKDKEKEQDNLEVHALKGGKEIAPRERVAGAFNRSFLQMGEMYLPGAISGIFLISLLGQLPEINNLEALDHLPVIFLFSVLGTLLSGIYPLNLFFSMWLILSGFPVSLSLAVLFASCSGRNLVQKAFVEKKFFQFFYVLLLSTVLAYFLVQFFHEEFEYVQAALSRVKKPFIEMRAGEMVILYLPLLGAALLTLRILFLTGTGEFLAKMLRPLGDGCGNNRKDTNG